MNLKVKYNLWKTRKALSPAADFKNSLWDKLSTEWQASGLPGFTWYQTHGFRLATAGLVVAVFCSSLGIGAYAYTSPDVTEWTLLYPLKQKLEQVEEATKITPEARAKFFLKKIDRREAERDVLKRRQAKLERVEAQIKETEDKLEVSEKALEKIELRDKTLRPKIKERLEHRLEKRKETLEKKRGLLQERKEKLGEFLRGERQPVSAATTTK